MSAPAASPLSVTDRPARSAVGFRLMAGPSQAGGYEKLTDQVRRLGARRPGGAWMVEELARSGLRGRGGAWFPTWKKWAAVREHSVGHSVVVVNASEGEPLSSKDRTLVALRPHLVLDGAALAAESIGADEIVIYLSIGSKNVEESVRRALDERHDAGLSEAPCRIVMTQHRYVAGESSAVVGRVSGGASKPSFSLGHSAEKGVDGRPTLVQNAETLAHAAMIARYGSDWFRRLGTEGSPGSTLMTVCGNVANPGVYEVDLGARLGGVLDAAGGPLTLPAGALLGGYFGAWLHGGRLRDLPLDSDRLRASVGTSLGCGVLAVLPSAGCGIVESSRILTYLAAETAGQCGPCVNGLAALSEATHRIAISEPESGDLERVQRWVGMVRGRGACHHPDGAVGQLASALAVFKDHLWMHMNGRRCSGLEGKGFPRPPKPGSGWR